MESWRLCGCLFSPLAPFGAWYGFCSSFLGGCMLVFCHMMPRFSTAFTHRSPKEAGPHHLRDGCVLGAAAVAGYRHLCHIRFSSWSVPFHQYILITFKSNLHPSDSTFRLACVSCKSILWDWNKLLKYFKTATTTSARLPLSLLMMERNSEI